VTCETLIQHTHSTHVSPLYAAAHWRVYADMDTSCAEPATLHVTCTFADGQVVERDLCRDCAEQWMASVRAQEAGHDIPSMYPRSSWTVEERTA
jgi:hypothetical protein